jgi:hypothetical protein
VKTERTDEGYIFDFGAETVGDFCFRAEGAGTARVRYGEYYEEIFSDPAVLAVEWFRTPSDKFAIDGAAECRSDGRRAFRYARVFGEGFKITDAWANEESYPFGPAATFRCSDERLNRVWEICERATQLCSQQYFEDGIKRDGLLWIGDARVQAQCVYALYGDTALARKSLYLFAASMRGDGRMPSNAILGGAHIHPEKINYMFDYVRKREVSGIPEFYSGCGEIYYLTYACDFISMLWEYYFYSGDLQTVKELFPVAAADMRYVCDTVGEKTDGLLLFPTARDLSAGGRIDTLGDNAAYFSCLARALGDYARLAAAVGDEGERDGAERRRGKFLALIRKKYLDPRGYLRAEDYRGGRIVSLSAQSLGHLCGILDEESARGAFQSAANDPDCAAPIDGMSRYHVYRGMFEAGLGETALDCIRDCWGYMSDKGATACWEKLDTRRPDLVEGDATISRCHGWSAGPAALFARYLLGARQTEPGGAVEAKPSLHGLDFVEGAIPTLRGELRVYADRRGARAVLQ